MKLVYFIFFVIVAVFAQSGDDYEEEVITDDKEWENYKKKFNKIYKDASEEQDKKSIFLALNKEIKEHNDLAYAKKVTYRMGHNEFSDIPQAELAEKLTRAFSSFGATNENRANPTIKKGKKKPPRALNWRHWYRGDAMITDIKNQGLSCRSGYSFAVTGALEGQYFLKYKKLISFSEQQIIDCSGGEFGNEGCDGGLVKNAYEYIKNAGKIISDKQYSYKGIKETCHSIGDVSVPGTSITAYQIFQNITQDQLKLLVANVGPVAVAIDASSPKFLFYNSGIYTNSECKSNYANLNHAALIIGYGTTKKNEDYWIVKNSWGKSWGREGYVWMARTKDNNCGIAAYVTYPIVA